MLSFPSNNNLQVLVKSDGYIKTAARGWVKRCGSYIINKRFDANFSGFSFGFNLPFDVTDAILAIKDIRNLKFNYINGVDVGGNVRILKRIADIINLIITCDPERCLANSAIEYVDKKFNAMAALTGFLNSFLEGVQDVVKKPYEFNSTVDSSALSGKGSVEDYTIKGGGYPVVSLNTEINFSGNKNRCAQHIQNNKTYNDNSSAPDLDHNSKLGFGESFLEAFIDAAVFEGAFCQSNGDISLYPTSLPTISVNSDTAVDFKQAYFTKNIFGYTEELIDYDLPKSNTSSRYYDQTNVSATNVKGIVITMPIQIDFDVSGIKESFTAKMDAILNFDNILLSNGSWGDTALSIKALSVYNIAGGTATIRDQLETSLESFAKNFNVIKYENNYYEPCNPGSSLEDYNSSEYFENLEYSFDDIFMNHITQFDRNCPKCSTKVKLSYENDQIGNLGFKYFGGIYKHNDGIYRVNTYRPLGYYYDIVEKCPHTSQKLDAYWEGMMEELKDDPKAKAVGCIGIPGCENNTLNTNQRDPGFGDGQYDDNHVPVSDRLEEL